MNKSYIVPEGNLDNFYAQIANLNRKARKLGVSEIILRKTGKIEEHPIHNERNEKIGVYRLWEIEVSGETPKIAGWSFSAVIEPTEEGNILRKSPECTDDLMEYRTAKPCCDHCQTTRTRKETFVLTHDDGSRKQVGSSCIKDFLGHADPHALAAWAELLFSVGEVCTSAEFLDGEYCARENPLIGTTVFLSYAIMTIRRLGYVSGKREKEDLTGRTTSTRQQAMIYLKPSREDLDRCRRRGEEWPRPTDEDRQQAEVARQFTLNALQDRNDLSDFEHNLLVAVKCEALGPKSLGIVAYVPEYYRRATEQAAVAAESKWFGEPGTRYRDVSLTYLRSTGWESQYGYTYLHTFATESGESLFWKTGTNDDFVAGMKYLATFTVKAHEEFKGKKQTKITRADITSAELAETAA